MNAAGRCHLRGRRRAARSGFSLLEVLLATSILLGCTIVLSELAAIGSRNAATARDLAQAQLLCQSRMNEMLAGAVPLAPQRAAPVEEAPGWTCAVEVDPAGPPGLSRVRVTVAQEKEIRGRREEFTLVRWARNRTGRAAQGPLPAADVPPEPAGLPTAEARQ